MWEEWALRVFACVLWFDLICVPASCVVRMQTGATSLHLACYAGHRGAAEWLASHAEFAECDAHGWTFAHAACTGGHPQVLEFLDSQAHAEFEAVDNGK